MLNKEHTPEKGYCHRDGRYSFAHFIFHKVVLGQVQSIHKLVLGEWR